MQGILSGWSFSAWSGVRLCSTVRGFVFCFRSIFWQCRPKRIFNIIPGCCQQVLNSSALQQCELRAFLPEGLYGILD